MPMRSTADGDVSSAKQIHVTVRRDGSGEVVIDDTRYPIAQPTLQDARQAATGLVVTKAAQLAGGPVRVQTSDPAGASILIVHPDGSVRVEGGHGTSTAMQHPVDEPPPSSPEKLQDSTGWSARQDLPTSVRSRRRSATSPTPEPRGVESAEDPNAASLAGLTAAAPGRHVRKSFIDTEAPIDPAQAGIRGALARVGVRTAPSLREQALRRDIGLVSQHWPGPRTVAVANPKGSANKTPTTVCLSAVFARYGGGPVLAWDNNETRGTAAWRTLRGPHEATVLDLLPKTDELLGVGAQAAELARHVHHQPADKFDVLWSDQSTEGEHEVTGAEVDAIHEVAAKYYRLVLMDSGNSERASNWRAMIRNAHALVVPCTNVEDTAEAGARMLEALAQRDQHSTDLARSAVAIISQRTPGDDARMRRIVRDFAPLVRTVVTIPHDPALYTGIIRFDALRSATQRAWLAAAAAVAEGL